MSLIEELLKNAKVEWKKLGEISKVTKLAGFEFTKYVTYTDSGRIIALRGLNIKHGNIILEDVKYVDNSKLEKLSRSKLYIGDILFTYVGTVGEVAVVNENDRFYLAPNVALIRPLGPRYLSRYIMHYLMSTVFKNNQLAIFVKKSSMKNITMEAIRDFLIPIPPLALQAEIVRILDTFAELIVQLTAELTLREKQYEYYREKLLTFNSDD